jgi:hypothetical protein
MRKRAVAPRRHRDDKRALATRGGRRGRGGAGAGGRGIGQDGGHIGTAVVIVMEVG